MTTSTQRPTPHDLFVELDSTAGDDTATREMWDAIADAATEPGIPTVRLASRREPQPPA